MEIIEVEPVIAEGPFPEDPAIAEMVESQEGPEIGKCAACDEPILEHQARTTFENGSMYHPEHVNG